MSFVSLLRHSVLVERNTPTVGATGAQTDSWATVATISALVQPPGKRYDKTSGGFIEDDRPRLFAEFSADLRLGDRVTYGATRYRVVDVDDAAGQAHHFECSLDLIPEDA